MVHEKSNEEQREKKGKKKSAAKELKITQVKEQKQTKPGKLKESAKALRKEIERLTQELALRDKQLKGLIDASRADLELVSEAELLSQRLLDSSHTGSISERKKSGKDISTCVPVMKCILQREQTRRMRGFRRTGICGSAMERSLVIPKSNSIVF